MSSSPTIQTYSVSKVKQLIDLNGDAINFKVIFDVRSKDKSPFEAVIIDQTNLDKNEQLDFKQAPGVLSGEILADRNTYQNYYLALRSTEPKEIDVQLQFERLPDFIPLAETQEENKESNTGLFRQSNSTLKIALLVIILIVSIFLYMKTSKLDQTKPQMKTSLLDKLKKVNIPN